MHVTNIYIKLFFLIVLVIPLISCNDNNKNQTNNNSIKFTQTNTIKSSDVPQNNVDIILSSFCSVPDAIDGCGDYYLFDTTEISSEHYIFLSSMRELAAINLNDNIIYLNFDSTKSIEFSNRIYDVYKNKDSLQVILDVKKYKEYEEGAFYRGKLIIEKGVLKKEFKVHGQTGC